MEELITKKLTGAIFGLKNGSKTTSDVQGLLDKLKKINSALAEDYEKKYIAAVRDISMQRMAS